MTQTLVFYAWLCVGTFGWGTVLEAPKAGAADDALYPRSVDDVAYKLELAEYRPSDSCERIAGPFRIDLWRPRVERPEPAPRDSEITTDDHGNATITFDDGGSIIFWDGTTTTTTEVAR